MIIYASYFFSMLRTVQPGFLRLSALLQLICTYVVAMSLQITGFLWGWLMFRKLFFSRVNISLSKAIALSGMASYIWSRFFTWCKLKQPLSLRWLILKMTHSSRRPGCPFLPLACFSLERIYVAWFIYCRWNFPICPVLQPNTTLHSCLGTLL